LHVPIGASATVEPALAAIPNIPLRTTRLRWGESVSELAASYGMSARALLELSGLPAEHRVTGGTELLVPDRAPQPVVDTARPLVLVSPVSNVPTNRRRVFYRAGVGDTLRDIARALDVSREDLIAWNQLDPAARVPAGLWLQAWIEREPTQARVRSIAEVDTAERGTDASAERIAAQDGRVRLVVTVRQGDTMSSLAARYGLTTGSLSRINRRSRYAPLVAGESLVVWVTPDRAERERVREADVPLAPTSTSSASSARVAIEDHGGQPSSESSAASGAADASELPSSPSRESAASSAEPTPLVAPGLVASSNDRPVRSRSAHAP
jgi:LysM repeat protein